jgi:hypothetical protein
VSRAPGLIRSPRNAVKPAPRGRIKIVPLHRGIPVAEILPDLLSCQFPDNTGDAP